MTLVASWIGVDTHGISSAYIVSDSKFSYGSKKSFEYGKKVFASKIYPELFGYAGDVLFPTIALSQIIEMIDSNLIFNEELNCDDKNKIVYEKLIYTLNKYPENMYGNVIEITHISRDTKVIGYPNYYCYFMKWEKNVGWKLNKIDLPEKSDIVYVHGSGKKEFLDNYKRYQNGEDKNTSRNVFHCFLDTLDNIDDPYCGGAPQLVGCYRKPFSGALNFGIVYKNKRYLLGMEVPRESNFSHIQWRNEEFEITNGERKKRIPSAAKQPNRLLRK